jgi:hypothetical protein
MEEFGRRQRFREKKSHVTDQWLVQKRWEMRRRKISGEM